MGVSIILITHPPSVFQPFNSFFTKHHFKQYVNLLYLIMHRHAPRPGTTRESRAQFFPVMKVFNEVSGLLGSPIDIRRSEEHTRETEPENERIPSSSDSAFLGALFVSSDV